MSALLFFNNASIVTCSETMAILQHLFPAFKGFKQKRFQLFLLNNKIAPLLSKISCVICINTIYSHLMGKFGSNSNPFSVAVTCCCFSRICQILI